MSGHSAHCHGHRDNFARAFAVGIALNIGFVAVEVIFGFKANSMALLSDAGHNFSDVLGLMVAWAGGVLARRGSAPRFSYGLNKTSILAALANALMMVVRDGVSGAEAISRMVYPCTAQGRLNLIFFTACVAVKGAS